MTNILVTAMLLCGGSAVASDLSGVPTAAACFLLPIGVVLYTMFGGIKATFLTDYVHTVIIFAIILTFAFSAYATNTTIGSPKKVYELLVKAAAQHPVEGNAEGSYLSMQSREGAIFFVINIVGRSSSPCRMMLSTDQVSQETSGPFSSVNIKAIHPSG